MAEETEWGIDGNDRNEYKSRSMSRLPHLLRPLKRFWGKKQAQTLRS
ncbi:Uncharacterized protein APZ42_028976 [Daphnia magna]|uniref:Uncharacterized protein n=1 Tax=Daphnia magna TaxID=35525 RepID=A0A164Q107_9CRUS|nr:Uncharacterized protein APZ42_028976 [Daphnia magna]